MTADVRDEARRAVAARGLTPTAVVHLTRDALGTVDLAALAPVKKLLKRFFSDEPWSASDEDELATLVGPGDGWWTHELDDDFALEFGWRDKAFRMEVAPRRAPGDTFDGHGAVGTEVAPRRAPGDTFDGHGAVGTEVAPRRAPGDTFDGPVVPEATPNPRTIRFVTPKIHDGPSRWYESAADADDPRVERLFGDFDDVANVLVGPSFVAVGLRRPDRWEPLLDPILRAVTAEFADPTADRDPEDDVAPRDERARAHTEAAPETTSAFERAWNELGSLRPEEPGGLDRIRAAATSENSADRQVAARRLVDAKSEIAQPEWTRLLQDPSRSVRRAVVDAIVDAARPALRPLLERALSDTDAWTRWKALRGLVDLGIEPSRAAVRGLTEDPDFRVRLEAAGALRATTSTN